MSPADEWSVARSVAAAIAITAARAAAADPPAPPPLSPTPRGASEDGPPIAEYPGVEADAAGRQAGHTPGGARNLAYEPEDPGAVALAVSRALLAIPRAALDIVFFPLRATAGFLDEHRVVEHAIDILYNDERTAAFYPIVFKEPEYPLSLGMGAFHHDLFGHGESIDGRVLASSLIEYSADISFEAYRLLGSPAWLELDLRLDRGASLLFAGIGHLPIRDRAPRDRRLGPRQAAVESWLRQNRVHGRLRSGVSFGPDGKLARVGLTGTVNHRQLEPNHDQTEPSVEEVYDTSRLGGFDEAQTVAGLDIDLVVDTRDRDGLTRDGMLLEAYAGGVPARGELRGWLRYGFDWGGWVDLYRERILRFRLAVDAIAGDAEEIPLAELPRLGGARRLRGYPTGRFRDLSTAAASVEYQYPIHAFVAGSLFVDMGKVGRDFVELFGEDPDGIRPGIGGGLVIHDRNDLAIRVDIAWGLDQGVGVYFSVGALNEAEERQERP